MNNRKEKGSGKIFFNFFSSVKLTIFLLILLAIISIVGTIITQNAPKSEYVKRYGIEFYRILNFFDLFDMYHSWWFSSILFLLVLNLIVCSINRLKITWRQVFKSELRELDDSMLKGIPYIEKVNINNHIAPIKDKIYIFLKKGFRNPRVIEGPTTLTLFSEKGKFSRFGIYITHLSVIIILIGGLLGSIYGFKGFINILEGDTVDFVYVRSKDEDVPKPLDFSIRCDDFQIIYYDLPGQEKYVKEYISVLTIIENGKEVLKKSIEVNHPLYYKGLALYQASYGTINEITIGLKRKNKIEKEKILLKIQEGETIPIENTDLLLRVLRYVPQVHNFGEGVQLAVFRPNREPEVFWILKNLPDFDKRRGDELIFTLEDVNSKEYTGLQVTKDPGVQIVWIGCGLLIIGLFVSFFFSHKRIWIRIPKSQGEIIIAGSTNKNKFAFEKSFREIADKIRSLKN